MIRAPQSAISSSLELMGGRPLLPDIEWPDLSVADDARGEEPFAMGISTVGLDLGKRVFQVHGVDATGRVTVRRKLQRVKMLGFFAAVPPCLVGMEACATAHHWTRQIRALGHDVRLIPPA